MERVLLVDSNTQITQTLKEHLALEYHVEHSHPRLAVEHFEKHPFKVVIFCTEDIASYPDVLKSLAARCKTLVVVKALSAHRMQMMLDAGITDWLVEPLDFEHLNWKLRFLLHTQKQEGEVTPTAFTLAGLQVQPHEHRVITHTQTVVITPVQMRLLIAFYSFPNRLMTRDWLRFKVWNGEMISLRSIDAQVSKLKKLLPEIDGHLESVYGKGYIWKTTASDRSSDAS